MFINSKNKKTKSLISHFKSKIIICFLILFVAVQINYIAFPSFAENKTILILGESSKIADNAAPPPEECEELDYEEFYDCYHREEGITFPASFSPGYVCSKVNTPIIWTNNDDSKHSIIFTNLEQYNSGIINPSENFTRIFNILGNFSYFDATNPNMKGDVRIVSNEKDCVPPPPPPCDDELCRALEANANGHIGK